MLKFTERTENGVFGNIITLEENFSLKSGALSRL